MRSRKFLTFCHLCPATVPCISFCAIALSPQCPSMLDFTISQGSEGLVISRSSVAGLSWDLQGTPSCRSVTGTLKCTIGPFGGCHGCRRCRLLLRMLICRRREASGRLASAPRAGGDWGRGVSSTVGFSEDIFYMHIYILYVNI